MMYWAAAALIAVTAALLFRSVLAAEKKRCEAAIVIMCSEECDGLTEQVCAYHNDELAGGELYRRRILLVSPDGRFSEEALALAERFEDVAAISAAELAEQMSQGRS